MKWTIIVISIFLFPLSQGTCADLGRGVVCFKNYCFDVELAQTVEERTQGLMLRERLDPDKGILFAYKEEGKHPFWMKNTLIPLDIIWINKEKKVIFIGQNIQPCKAEPCPVISPNVKAKYVLELNAQTVEEIELSIGDKLEFDIINSLDSEDR